jgi:hypothetical protein
MKKRELVDALSELKTKRKFKIFDLVTGKELYGNAIAGIYYQQGALTVTLSNNWWVAGKNEVFDEVDYHYNLLAALKCYAGEGEPARIIESLRRLHRSNKLWIYDPGLRIWIHANEIHGICESNKEVMLTLKTHWENERCDIQFILNRSMEMCRKHGASIGAQLTSPFIHGEHV